MDIYEFERGLVADEGISGLYCGVDEAGRGPLSGPVCAAAVILKPGAVIEGLDDSKKVSEKKREELFDKVVGACQSYGVAFSSALDIEENGILPATFSAMNRAIEALNVKPELSLIDGNLNYGIKHPSMCIVKGDAKCASIAAASILAKVSRDRYMRALDEKYPEYLFSKHKGYGTKQHFEAIDKYGTCPEHRLSFLKKHLEGGKEAKQSLGAWGEDCAVNFLANKKFRILGRNYSSQFGEIDIIARNGEFLIFAEVKLRKNNSFAQAGEAVTRSKQEKIKATASQWLQENSTAENLQPRFDVIEIYAPKGRDSKLLEINHMENAFY